MGGAGQPLDFQLHQALGREADHFAQKIGVGALFQKRAKGHHLVGHRWIVNAGSNVPKCAEVKILSWAGFSVISRLDGDRWLRFLVADRGGAAVPELAS